MKHPERLEIASRRAALQTAWFAAAESAAERKRELSAVIQSHLAGDGSNLSFVRVGEAAIASALAEAEAEQARAAYLKI